MLRLLLRQNNNNYYTRATTTTRIIKEQSQQQPQRQSQQHSSRTTTTIINMKHHQVNHFASYYRVFDDECQEDQQSSLHSEKTSFSVKNFQQQYLRTDHIGRYFYHVHETTSTMDLLDAIVQPVLTSSNTDNSSSSSSSSSSGSQVVDMYYKTGAPTGFLVLADVQTAGRGRKGRAWHGIAGQNLYFSILFRLESGQFEQLIKLNLSLAIAIVKACHEFGASEARIKWPNDIWIPDPNSSDLNYRKLSGMLVNSSQIGSEMRANCGIGINVNEIIAQTGGAVASSTGISLREVVGRKLCREQVLASICNQLEQVLSLSLEDVLLEYQKYDLLVGKTIFVHKGNTSSSGGNTSPVIEEAMAIGFSKYGNLQVKYKNDSSIKELISEEVSIRL